MYLRSCSFLLFFLLLCLLWGCYVANTPLHLGKIPSKAQVFNLQPQQLQRTLKSWKRPTSPVLSQERFRNNLFLLGDQTVNLFLDCSQRTPNPLLTQTMWADFPGPNPARPTLLPLLRLKLGLSSHRWTSSHVLNPCLPLEAPGALPTHHTDAPTGPRENSVGKLSLNTGHVI